MRIFISVILWLVSQSALDASSGYVVFLTPQSNIDLVWSRYASISDVTFQYSPGVYLTKGANSLTNATMHSNQHHIGAGSGQTVFRLIGSAQGVFDGRIFASWGTWISNWSCQGITLDINAANQPKWLVNQGKLAGIECWGGNNISLEDVEFINFGTSIKGVECFPCGFFSINESSPLVQDYITIDHCRWDSPAIGNKDGTTMCVIGDNPNGNVRCGPHCSVTNCSFLYCKSDFLYCQDVGAPGQIEYNSAINSGTFYYSEPVQPIFPNAPVIIDYNVVTGGWALFCILPHPPGCISSEIFIGVHNIIN